MANLATNITDIYEPQPWGEYFIEMNNDKNALVQAGIFSTDPDIQGAIAKGGRTIDLPFWNDLPHDTGSTTRSSVATDTDDEITPSGIDYGQDIAVRHFRTKAWEVSPILQYIAGSDPAQVILDRYVNWWIREDQRLLMKTLTGCFATTLATAHENDISDADGDNATAANKISLDAVEDTRFLLGDAYDKFAGMAMHSTVFKRLRYLNLIDMTPDSDQKLTIPTYNGLRVIVDDNMTTADGGTSGTLYYTYLFGQGAIAYSNIPQADEQFPNIVLDANQKEGTGAGSLQIITRKQFIIHPRGVAWQLTPSSVDYPTDTEIETGSSWSKVWDTKNVRLARLITNG